MKELIKRGVPIDTVMKKIGMISTEKSLPIKSGKYYVASPDNFSGIGKLKYDVKKGFLYPERIKKIFKVKYWKE